MKEKIICQSISLFEKKGYSETSIQDIVDMLEVTKGTFYYYFDSKQQLLKNIHLHFIDDLLSQQQQILADRDKDCKAKIFDTVKMLIRNIEKQGRSARVFFREMRNLNDDDLSEIMNMRDQFRIHLQKLVETGIREKELREDLPPDIVTFGILGICNWSYFWFEGDGPLSDEEVSLIYIEMILNGIKSCHTNRSV